MVRVSSLRSMRTSSREAASSVKTDNTLTINQTQKDVCHLRRLDCRVDLHPILRSITPGPPRWRITRWPRTWYIRCHCTSLRFRGLSDRASRRADQLCQSLFRHGSAYSKRHNCGNLATLDTLGVQRSVCSTMVLAADHSRRYAFRS